MTDASLLIPTISRSQAAFAWPKSADMPRMQQIETAIGETNLERPLRRQRAT